jgi:hypothetical protein
MNNKIDAELSTLKTTMWFYSYKAESYDVLPTSTVLSVKI